MKRFLSVLAVISGCSSAAEPLPERPAEAVRIATYNAHYIILSKATGSWSVGDWERRKEPLDQAFKALDADIVGFQEMESFAHGSDGSTNLARDWLAQRNADYGVAASGDWRKFPSTQPIFYRRARLNLLDQGWFFFSKTPDVIYSKTFNGSYPAFASWAQFEDVATQKRLRVLNLHFDYSSGSNQRQSAALVAKRITPWIKANERVFVIGDVNAGLSSTPVKTMSAAGVSFLPVKGSTYHWNRGINVTGAIDHLGHSSGIKPAGPAFVLRQKFGGEWPTDHYPVIGDFMVE